MKTHSHSCVSFGGSFFVPTTPHHTTPHHRMMLRKFRDLSSSWAATAPVVVLLFLCHHPQVSDCFSPTDFSSLSRSVSSTSKSTSQYIKSILPASSLQQEHDDANFSDGDYNNNKDTTGSTSCSSRRFVLSTLFVGVASTTPIINPQSMMIANAAEQQEPSSSSSSSSTSSASDILLRLRDIPTFCIVNSAGVPYMIFDGSASATGYFFLSFKVAAEVLSDARKKDTSSGGKWDDATIITVPLAVALQLTLRKIQRKAVNNELSFNTYNDIVASEEGVEDAQLIDSSNPDRWVQKGRVPLFYVDELIVDDGLLPRYFNKADLINEWNRQYPNKDIPKIKLVEMIDLFRFALVGGGKGGGGGGKLDSIQNLKLIPVVETQKVASELRTKSGSTTNYNLKEVFLVQSAKG